MKSTVIFIVAWVVCLAAVPCACAEKVVIAFTGQSFASLYPCACPHDPEGGVARRATVIKELRAKEPHLIVVEAGDSVGSGADDANAQGKEMDLRRTQYYLGALKTIGYDALLASRQDLAFGEDFLKKVTAPAFVSSNTTGLAVPYVIKAFGKLKVGIIGLTDRTTEDAAWGLASDALKKTLEALKREKVALAVVLSAVTPSEDIDFTRQITDLPIVVINGRPSYGSVSLIEEGNSLFMATWWQAKRVSVLTLEVADGKIKGKNLAMVSLGTGVADDPGILKVLPVCLRDDDCSLKEGFLAQCLDATTPNARCVYTPKDEAPLVSVIIPRDPCRTCRPAQVLDAFEQRFGKVRPVFLRESDPAARESMKELKIRMLPAYVFDKSIERHAKFDSMKEMLDIGPAHAMLKPGVAGVSFFVGRPRIAKRLDLFFDFEYSDVPGLFSLLKDFQEKHPDWDVHFNYLALWNRDHVLTARGGKNEIQEFKRTACLAKAHPRLVYDYVICRASQRNAAWRELCVTPLGMKDVDLDRCAASAEGEKNLLDHFRLTDQLEVATGPTFLVENVEVFGIAKVPSLDQFEQNVTGQNAGTGAEDK